MGELEGEGISTATDRDHVRQWGCLTPIEGVADEKRRTREKGGKRAREQETILGQRHTRKREERLQNASCFFIRRLRDALYTCGLH